MPESFFQQVQESKATQSGDKDLATYETPLVTVDIVVFTVNEGSLKALLIQRRRPPYQHMWAIPGGFIHVGESIEEAAQRRLFEETNVKDIYLEQLHSFGDPHRDPRARVITVSYYALISSDKLTLEAHANAEDVSWYCVSELPELAFDHKRIVNLALLRLKERFSDSNIAFQLLPGLFTLTELQRVYELVTGKNLDKRNFRKKMLSSGMIIETDETKMDGYHRPAQLYKFQERHKVQMYGV